MDEVKITKDFLSNLADFNVIVDEGVSNKKKLFQAIKKLGTLKGVIVDEVEIPVESVKGLGQFIRKRDFPDSLVSGLEEESGYPGLLISFIAKAFLKAYKPNKKYILLFEGPEPSLPHKEKLVLKNILKDVAKDEQFTVIMFTSDASFASEIEAEEDKHVSFRQCRLKNL